MTIQKQVQHLVPVYLLSLLTFPLFFLTNYLFNHQRHLLAWLPEGRPVYFFAVLLPFGTILPGLALGWLIRCQKGSYRTFGATLTGRDFLTALVSFAIGLIAIYFAVKEKVSFNDEFFGSAIHYFIWLLIASIPEVLVFIGNIYHMTEAFVKNIWSGKGSSVIAAIGGIMVSAIAFGLFHFSYPAPWNTWEKIMTLIPVWLVVAGLYALTRSLVATVVFNNMMAIIGFLLYNLSLPGSEILGLILDCIAIISVITVVLIINRRLLIAK